MASSPVSTGTKRKRSASDGVNLAAYAFQADETPGKPSVGEAGGSAESATMMAGKNTPATPAACDPCVVRAPVAKRISPSAAGRFRDGPATTSTHDAADSMVADHHPNFAPSSFVDRSSFAASVAASLDFDPNALGSRAEAVARIRLAAEFLVNRCVLRTRDGGHAWRFAEVEGYLKADIHPDVFTHSHEDQLPCATFYFHKMGKGYKGGSYKGLDITFGRAGTCFGGMLLRSMVPVDPDTGEPLGESWIEGPCCLVDTILAAVGAESILALVDRPDYSDDVVPTIPGAVLFLDAAPETMEVLPLVATPRVGLTLKKRDGERLEFVMRPYRFLAFPGRHKKGKPHIVLSLYSHGVTTADIAARLGTAQRFVDKYAAQFDLGRAAGNPGRFFGKALKTADVCELYGALHAAGFIDG